MQIFVLLYQNPGIHQYHLLGMKLRKNEEKYAEYKYRHKGELEIWQLIT
jgi:hypothetical protein